MPATDPSSPPPFPPPHHPVVAAIRSHHAGVHCVADRFSPVQFVIDPATGLLICKLDRSLIDEPDHIIVMPDETDPVVQLMIKPPPSHSFDPALADSPAADRFAAYHPAAGTTLSLTLLACTVTAAKAAPHVADASEIDLRNALGRRDELTALRALNADRAVLATLIAQHSRACVPNPLAVGADQLGIDIRAPFGILRIQLPYPASNATDLLTQLNIPSQT